MPVTDPYKLLKIDPGASGADIKAAYDRLFDRYELRAEQGDTAAIAMLDRLNEAHDQLLYENDSLPRPAQSSRATSRMAAPGSAAAPRAKVPWAVSAPGGVKIGKDAATAVVRPRRVATPRAIPPAESRSKVPYIMVGALALVLVASLVYLLASRQDVVPEAPRGNIVATVNGVPIYEREFNERIEKDKRTALSDPLFAPFFENFQGITGTRALDVLRYDALDKLINMEVIQQQAKKDSKYPGPQQRAELVAQAKAGEIKAGDSFPDFLRRVGVSEAQYNARVVENFVYTVMAEAYMPKTGSDSEKTEGFIRWICDTRKNYDAVMKVSFIVPENKPCTSGLPTDIPLPGLAGEGTPLPEPVGTAQGPALPPVQASPAPTGQKPADQ